MIIGLCLSYRKLRDRVLNELTIKTPWGRFILGIRIIIVMDL